MGSAYDSFPYTVFISQYLTTSKYINNLKKKSIPVSTKTGALVSHARSSNQKAFFFCK